MGLRSGDERLMTDQLDQLALLGYCLYCKELFRTDLSTAEEQEDFCCGSHEHYWHLEIEDDCL